MPAANPPSRGARTSALAGVFLLAATLAACRTSGAGDLAPPTSGEADAQAINDVFGRLAEATNARDFSAFEADLTGGWTYFTSGGSEVRIEGFADMISEWTELHIEVMSVRPRLSGDGRLAWATLRGHLTGESNGVATERRLRFTGILHRTDSGWKLRHLQSTIASDTVW